MSKQGILVCGSGVAGLATALGLARKGFNVELLGPPPPRPPLGQDDYHPRVYAISQSSRSLLESLGVWQMMEARRVTPVEAMEVHGDAAGMVMLNAWQASQDALAWIVESGEMERVLQQAIQVYGLRWWQEKFTHLEGRVVCTESGRRLPFDLLVGADGARSPVRHSAGIFHESRPYGDSGVVAHLDAELPHQNVAVQWFTGDSILALLPMPDTANGHQVSMVWSLPEQAANELMAMEPEARADFLEKRLAAATGGRWGRLKLRSTPFAFPLFLERSGMIGPGIALVSDAAHRVHPLAGQGLNLGLGDVQELLNILSNKESYRSVGDERVLKRYRRARAQPILAMSVATDGLHRLFASQAAPVVALRNLGMQAVDRLPMIKRFLIGGAAG
ncbi:FAD-dependent monooxygenase [Achromobacter sp. F4_2707]|uniref:FAD-dependent monooxygenase n=1 Tax=Achromobacter sp. F4_2707 TaxID=3114286 RepID=UPI0039C71A92